MSPFWDMTFRRQIYHSLCLGGFEDERRVEDHGGKCAGAMIINCASPRHPIMYKATGNLLIIAFQPCNLENGTRDENAGLTGLTVRQLYPTFRKYCSWRLGTTDLKAPSSSDVLTRFPCSK